MWYFVASSLVVTVPVSLPPLSSLLKNLFKALLLSCRGSWIPWSMLIARIYFLNLGDDTVVVCLVDASQLRCKEQLEIIFWLMGKQHLLRLPLGYMWKKSCVSTLNCPDLKMSATQCLHEQERFSFCHLSDGKVFTIKNTAIVLHILLTDHYYFNS